MRTCRRAVLAALVSAGPCLCAAQPVPPEYQDSIGLPLGRPGVPNLSAPKGVVASFQNGSFETVSGGEPVGWTKEGSSELRQDGGNTYARVSVLNRYKQFVPLPIRSRHFTVSARYRSGDVNLPMVMTFVDDGRQIVFERTVVSLPAGDWTRVYATHSIRTATGPAEVFPVTAHQLYWTDVDDVAIFDEGIANGGFDLVAGPDDFPQWVLGGGAAIANEALELPVGASATTTSTAAPQGQSYFVAFRADVAGGDQPLQLLIDDIDAIGGTVGEIQETGVQLATGEAFHAVETGEVAKGVKASRVTLANEGPGSIAIDDVSRGFVHVWPPDYDPSPLSLNPELSLVAAWPRRVVSATATIRDSGDAVVATIPMSVALGTATASWDGTGRPTGSYTARFELHDGAGGTVTLDRSFELRDDLAAPPDPPPFVSAKFNRGAWIWILDLGPEEEAIKPFFEAAAADGFNFATVFARRDQWAAVRSACEEVGMPFMAAGDLLQEIVRLRRPGISPIAFTTFREEVLAEFGDIVGSPMLMGMYPTDEPETPYEFDNATAAVRAIAASPEFGPSFVTISPLQVPDDPLSIIRPAAYWTDFYPFADGSIDFTAGLRALSDHIVEQVAHAKTLGREYWLVAQGWSETSRVHPGNAAAIRATIGLCVAHGAKGYIPFPYRQITSLEGLRTQQVEPLPETSAWREENERIAGIESELVGFAGHAELPGTGDSLVVTTASSIGGGTIVTAVSLESRLHTRVALGIEGDDAQLVELTELEPPRSGAGAQEFELEPGGWRIWRLSDGVLVSASSAPVSGLPQTLDLPVTGDVTISPIEHVVYRPAGGQVIASCGSRVYRVLTNGTILTDLAVQSVVASAWLSPFDAYLFSPVRGITSIRLLTPPTLTDRILRETGAAEYGLVAGNTLWTTGDFLGVRTFGIQGTDLVENAYDPLASSDLLDPAGVLLDGRVVFPSLFDGVIAGRAADSETIELESLDELRIMRNASLTTDASRLAVARMRRGFVVMDLDASGAVLGSSLSSHRGEYVAAVAWIDGSTLAVAEIDGDVEFFGVGTDLSLTLRGRWRPEPRPALGLASMDAANGILAMGFRDGRLVFVDATDLPERFDDGSAYWMLN